MYSIFRAASLETHSTHLNYHLVFTNKPTENQWCLGVNDDVYMNNNTQTIKNTQTSTIQ